MFNVPDYSTQSYADPQMQEIMKLEGLTIAEYIKSQNLYKMMTVDVGTQYDLSDTNLEEVVAEKMVSPRTSEEMFSPRTSENTSENVDCKGNSTSWISSDIDTLDGITEFICPPELCKKKPEKKEPEYDSDDTIDDYVECGEEGLCKCQRMWGREFYEYYMRNKDKELYTMYPQGKCELPKGAVFHFTGAPDNMKREDVNEALVALGAKIKFLDYQSGSKEGWARLSYPYEAKIIIKKMIDKKKLKIAGADLEFRVLSGKDEKRYHKKAIEAIYKLQVKAKGLEKQLRKAGYSYVAKYNPDDGTSDHDGW